MVASACESVCVQGGYDGMLKQLQQQQVESNESSIECQAISLRDHWTFPQDRAERCRVLV